MSVMTATAPPHAPADVERERLAELEETIASGLDAYVRVGRALEEIRTRRLYLLTHRTFREYLAERWNLSHPRGFSLCYSAQVADVLEAAGEAPAGAESALREFSGVLNRDGPETVVAAFREIAPDGVLPPAPKVRRELVAAGLIDKPARNVADGMQRRIRWLEQAVPQIKPHERLRPLLTGYAVRLRALVDQLDALAPPVGPDEPCLSHGVRRREDGLCAFCVRPEQPPRR